MKSQKHVAHGYSRSEATHTKMVLRSRLAVVIAFWPACTLLAASCGGTDYVDPPGAGLSDGSVAQDGSLSDRGSPTDGSTVSDRGNELPSDAAFGDARDADAADATDATVDAADAKAAVDAADANATDVPALRSAKAFAVLAGSTVTNNGAGTTIVGRLGVSPGLAVTGLPAGQPSGTVHVGADGVAVQAQLDLTTLYNDLAGRPCPPANVLTGQDLAGKTLLPGVYCFSSSAALGVGSLTLNANGNPNAFWVFQIASTLDVAASTVTVTNGGTPCNVFWQVGSSATVLDNALFAGNIVALSSITLNTGAAVSPGRALARNGAVTLLQNQISTASCQ